MTIIVFPGQGSQKIGMSRDFYENFTIAREVFEKISNISKIDIEDIIFHNPSNLLNQTQYTQLAIYCASMSIFEVIKSKIDIKNFNFSHMLGHSLGEYSALTASGILNIEDCSILLKKRGELMQNAYQKDQSGMAALIGKDCQSIQNIIDLNNLNVEIANDNSPTQVVISGVNHELKNSENIFIKNGVKKFVLLNVSAAFHSKLMYEAEKNMKEFIDNVNFNQSKISIISNFSGKSSNKIEIIKKNISNQMSGRVRWLESIRYLESRGDYKIIEIGPGKVLSGLIKRISNKFIIKNVEFISDIDSINNEF